MRRGDLYRLRRPPGDVRRSRVFVVVSRQALVDTEFSSVICAPIYSNDRGLETQVSVGENEGLKHASVIACDGLMSIPKRELTDYVGSLGATRLAELDQALRVALAVEC